MDWTRRDSWYEVALAFFRVTPPAAPIGAAAWGRRKEFDPSRLGIYCVKLDPFDDGIVWWGAAERSSSLYPATAIQGLHGWAEWRRRWKHCESAPGAGFHVALDHARFVLRNIRRRAGQVYFATTAPNGVICSKDGGRTWIGMRRGLWGQTIRRLCSFLIQGRPALVSLAVTSNEFSWNGGESWDERCSLKLPRGCGGCTWGVAPIPRRFQARGKLRGASWLVVTGLPSARTAGHGLFAFRAGLVRAGQTPVVRLTQEPAAALVVSPLNDRYVFMPLQVGGLLVYDLQEQKSLRFEEGLPVSHHPFRPIRKPGEELRGTLAVHLLQAGGRSAVFLSTTRSHAADSDLYALRGKGQLYRAMPVFDGDRIHRQLKWTRVDPVERDANPAAGVFVAFASDGQRLLALSSKGELLATEDAFAPRLSWIAHRIRVPNYIDVSRVELFTGLVVDWRRGIVWVSSMGGGVCEIPLDDAFRPGLVVLEARSFRRGLGTRLVRSLARSADGKWLFAGTQWMSAWRCRIGDEEKASRRR